MLKNINLCLYHHPHERGPLFGFEYIRLWWKEKCQRILGGGGIILLFAFLLALFPIL